MATAIEVAEWMLTEFRKDGVLYQDIAASSIEQQFGADFVYSNQNGNLAIAKLVLKEFRAISESEAVWIRSERCWRRRENYDEPGSRAAQ